MEEKKRPQSFPILARQIVTLVLALWLVFMVCLTWAVARDFRRQIHYMTYHMAGEDYHTHYGSDMDKALPGYHSMIRTLRLGESYQILRPRQLLPFVNPHTPNHWGSDDWIFGKWELAYGFQPAVIYYDEHNEILMKSGNILSFTYCTEESWKAQKLETAGVSWIDLDALPEAAGNALDRVWGFPTGDAPSRFNMMNTVLRFTGYFEGDQLIPVQADSAVYYGYNGMDQHEMFPRYDKNGALEWKNLYTAEAPADRELTTVYSWETGGYDYDHQSVVSNGRSFSSLVELLDAHIREDVRYSRTDSLLDCIIIYSGTMEDDPEVAKYALAVRCWPLQYAALRLIPTYLVSFGVVALALWLILRSLKRNLTEPLQELTRNLARDYPVEPHSLWKEPYALETLVRGRQEQQRHLTNENQQLKTALDYAKHAEENRRQMISHITHELKTPLAIIHSYAEGLQSGAAPEKQERYLDTILEESENLDAMVLEMLDFSRLESGKATLSQDHFSLLALTEEIAKKLAPAMEAKEQALTWGYRNECRLTADESRMAQVVTNLLTNAIRYGPRDSIIWLQVFADEKEAIFRIENYGEHMAPEQLEKIFESFYRADDSRTERSTGLGLPIAKSIVQLHRGRIWAENTWINGEKCLRFSFTIPLN